MSQAVGNTVLAYARVWHHVNAQERILGKLAERIAIVLMGKHKPIYDPSVDCGDYVVVSNASKIAVTGRKEDQLVYRKHSMFPGGLKETPYKVMKERKPDEIIRHAVSGMLPKNTLRERRLERLRIFNDDDIGVFQANIIKRWEDGTLPPAKPARPASHIHGQKKAEHKVAVAKRKENKALRATASTESVAEVTEKVKVSA